MWSVSDIGLSSTTNLQAMKRNNGMRKMKIFTAAALVAFATQFWAADAPAKPKLAPGPVEVTGKLQTGIMAIGGETTGTIISIPGQGTCEIDVRGSKDLQKSVENLDGKQVKVTGTLSVKEGVEIRERRIIKVQTLAAATEEKTDQKK
jgi:hypothetical protein